MTTLLTKQKQQTKKRQGLLAQPSLMREVDKIGKELEISTRTKTLAFLVKSYKEIQRNDESLPVATFNLIMKIDAPIVLCGIPGSGKSYTLDTFLEECKKHTIPFLLFNSDKRDHDWIQNRIDFAEVLGLQWLKNPGQYIVSLDHNLGVRQIVMEQISQSILMLEGDRRLEPWILAFEEGHDYYAGHNFGSLLRRMRKSTRKLIVVSTEAKLFEMCRPTRPKPFD